MRSRLATVLLCAAAPTAAAAAVPAAAQAIDARVGRLEGEMRAVQRKVFPGGAGQYVQPDIPPDDARPGPAPGTPASSPVADLSQRVSSLEGQMATLTGQIEQNQYRLRQIEDQFNAYRRTTDARLAAGAQSPVAGSDAAPYPAGGRSGERSPVTRSGADDDTLPAPPSRVSPTRGGTRASAGSVPTAATTAATIDPARGGRAAAVEKPDTGVPDEDAYLYGYRLWQAKLYPEAETQLKQVVVDYPKSKRASYAQNLLGRSFLDDGKANSAATAFYESYKKFPDGERAPDSLFYLATTLQKLNKPADACKVYGELTDVYGTKITPTMKADVAKGRVAAKCS